MLPHYSPVQGRRDLQRARRALPGPDRPRARPRRRDRPDDHPRAAARPHEGAARRLPGAARGAAGLLRGHDPGLEPARAAGQDPARAPRDARAVAARLLTAERGVGGRAGAPLRVRGLHQLRTARRSPRSTGATSPTACGSTRRGPPSPSGRSPPTPRRRRSGSSTSSRMAFTMLRRGRLIAVPPPDIAERFLGRRGRRAVDRAGARSSARRRRSAPASRRPRASTARRR